MCGFSSRSLKRQQDFWLFLLADIYFYRCIGPTIKDAVRRGRSRLPALVFFLFHEACGGALRPMGFLILWTRAYHAHAANTATSLRCQAGSWNAGLPARWRTAECRSTLQGQKSDWWNHQWQRFVPIKHFLRLWNSFPGLRKRFGLLQQFWESRSRHEFCRELFLPERTHIH